MVIIANILITVFMVLNLKKIKIHFLVFSVKAIKNDLGVWSLDVPPEANVSWETLLVWIHFRYNYKKH